MALVFKYQTGDDAPMHVLARPVVDGEDVPESKARLYPVDGLQVDTEPGISNEAVMSGIILVQLGLP